MKRSRLFEWHEMASAQATFTAFSSPTSGSEGNLRTHRQCVELGAGIPDVGRADLLGNVAVQVIKHETNVAVDVPVQTRAVDCLLSTGHAICGPELIVQIHSADTAGNLPRPPTAAPQRERICRGDA